MSVQLDEKYILLEKGEQVLPTDEFKVTDGVMWLSCAAAQPPHKVEYEKAGDYPQYLYRRKVR